MSTFSVQNNTQNPATFAAQGATATAPVAPAGAAAASQAAGTQPPAPSAAAKVHSPAFDAFIDPPGYVPAIETTESYDPNLVRMYKECLVNTPNGAEASSRLEAETKWSVDVQKLGEFRQKMQALVDDPTLRDKILGPGWQFSVVKKYFKKDGTVEPMFDQYYDSANFDLAKAEAALRFRWLKGDPFCAVNMKPGPGTTDSYGVTTRIEYALVVLGAVKNNPMLMERLFDSHEHANFFRHIKKLVPNLQAKDVLRPALEIIDYRYKLTAQHSNGTEIELSLDDVYATLSGQKPTSGSPLAVRAGAVGGGAAQQDGSGAAGSGAAQALPSEVQAAAKGGKVIRYGQLELEVNHKQLVQPNGAPIPTYTPTMQELIALEKQYQAAGHAGLPGQTRFHLPQDIKHPAIQQDPTYVTHQQFTRAMEIYLYGAAGNAPLGKQKAAVAAKMLQAV